MSNDENNSYLNQHVWIVVLRGSVGIHGVFSNQEKALAVVNRLNERDNIEGYCVYRYSVK